MSQASHVSEPVPESEPASPTELVNVLDQVATLIEPYDPEAIANEMFRRVLEAPDLDAAFRTLEGKTSEDYVGKTFHFDDCQFGWYQSDHGEIPSAKAKAIDVKTGEVVDFWTSAQVLVAFLAKAKLTHAFPVEWKIVEKLSRSGQHPLNFEQTS